MDENRYEGLLKLAVTSDDSAKQKFKQVTQEGWPEEPLSVPVEGWAYFFIRDRLVC